MKINKNGNAPEVKFESLESGEYFIIDSDNMLFRKLTNRQNGNDYSAVSLGTYLGCAGYGEDVRPHTLVQKVKINSICVTLCE